MKSYTDLEQSKKLAKILPIESADMTYCAITEGMREKMTIKNWEVNVGLDIAIKKTLFSYINGYMIPCWSLAALLDALPVSCDEGIHCLALINSNPNGQVDWLCCYEDCNGNLMMECYGTNQVDACYEMILKLNEQKLL